MLLFYSSFQFQSWCLVGDQPEFVEDMSGGGAKDAKETPTARLATNYCYNQTYVIMKKTNEPPDLKTIDNDDHHEVFFRCGNWCYQGAVQFNNLRLCTSELPVVIPLLQRQQGSLRYFCTASSIPTESPFAGPVEFMYEANEFIASEVTSEHIDRELRKWSSMYSWIDDDNTGTYFELSLTNIPECMDAIALIACKTYTRGLVIMSIFHESSVYFMLQAGEGDQQLLDVRFPDVSKHGQGLQVCCYNSSLGAYIPHMSKSSSSGDNSPSDADADSDSKGGRVSSAELAAALSTCHGSSWKKLTLWHIMEASGKFNSSPGKDEEKSSGGSAVSVKELLPKIKTLSVSSTNYQQTYCIMKSGWDRDAAGKNTLLSMYHDVLFRFGSWCYSGRIQLIPSLSLSDVPFVIPALRMQQSRLDFYCEASKVPTNSPFAACLAYMQQLTPVIERLIEESEELLNGLIDRLCKMGLGDSVKKWLEGDPENSFFEFRMAPDAQLEKMLDPMEIVCSKTYHPSGIITITILFQYTVYVCVLDGSNENPLLDSKFPDVSGKGRGYQIQAYNEGVEGWPQLRKISVWQTVASLEQEFRDRAAQLVAESQMKADGEEGGDVSVELNDSAAGGAVVVDSGGAAASDAKGGAGVESASVSASASASASSRSYKATIDSVANTSAAAEASSGSSTALTAPLKAEEKMSSSSDSPSTDSSSEKGGGSGAAASSLLRPALAPLGSISRPHHLPKANDALGAKMEEMRRKLLAQSAAEDGGGDGDGAAAPWDSTGRPLKFPANLSKK